MEFNKSKPYALARPQRLTFSRDRDITPDTPQKNNRHVDNTCPTTETSLPPTPASVSYDKDAILGDYEPTSGKRKRADSRNPDDDSQDCHRHKSACGAGGILDSIVKQYLEDALHPRDVDISELQLQQKHLENKQAKQGQRLDTSQQEIKRDVQALRTDSEKHASDIAGLTQTCDQRFQEQSRQAKNLSTRHDALSSVANGHTTELEALRTILTANTTSNEGAIKDAIKATKTLGTQLRNHKSSITTQLTGMEEELGSRITNVRTDAEKHIAKVDEELKQLMGEVDKRVDEKVKEELPKVAIGFDDQIAKIKKQLMAKVTKQEIQKLSSDVTAFVAKTANDTQVAMEAIIKAGDDDQGRKLLELRSDFASTLNNQNKTFEEKIAQCCTDSLTAMAPLRKDTDALRAKFHQYDDRLNRLTKEHSEQVVPVQQRITELRNSHETLSTAFSGVQSSLETVQQTTEKLEIETAKYQHRTDATMSKHTKDISDLQNRFKIFQDDVAMKFDPLSPIAVRCAPLTPAPRPTPSTTSDSSTDLAKNVEYPMEQDIKNRLYLEQHKGGLVSHQKKWSELKVKEKDREEKWEANEGRLTTMAKRLEKMEDIMSGMQTSYEEKLARMEKERQESEKRLDHAITVLHQLATNVSANFKSSDQQFEHLDQRINEVERKVGGNKTITDAKLVKVDRLLVENARTLQACATNNSEVRDDMEDRFDTAMVAIQEESRRSQMRSDQDLATIRQQFNIWWDEVSNKLNEAIESIDKHMDDRLTRYFAQLKELLKIQSERIDDNKTAQRRPSVTLAPMQPPLLEANIPAVDADEVKSLRKDVEKLAQALNERIDVVEATHKLSPLVVQLTSSTVGNINTLRYDVDTLIQNRAT